MTQRRLGSAGSSGAAKRGYDTEAAAATESVPPPSGQRGSGSLTAGGRKSPRTPAGGRIRWWPGAGDPAQLLISALAEEQQL